MSIYCKEGKLKSIMIRHPNRKFSITGYHKYSETIRVRVSEEPDPLEFEHELVDYLLPIVGSSYIFNGKELHLLKSYSLGCGKLEFLDFIKLPKNEYNHNKRRFKNDNYTIYQPIFTETIGNSPPKLYIGYQDYFDSRGVTDRFEDGTTFHDNFRYHYGRFVYLVNKELSKTKKFQLLISGMSKIVGYGYNKEKEGIIVRPGESKEVKKGIGLFFQDSPELIIPGQLIKSFTSGYRDKEDKRLYQIYTKMKEEISLTDYEIILEDYSRINISKRNMIQNYKEFYIGTKKKEDEKKPVTTKKTYDFKYDLVDPAYNFIRPGLLIRNKKGDYKLCLTLGDITKHLGTQAKESVLRATYQKAKNNKKRGKFWPGYYKKEAKIRYAIWILNPIRQGNSKKYKVYNHSMVKRLDKYKEGVYNEDELIQIIKEEVGLLGGDINKVNWKRIEPYIKNPYTIDK